MDIELREWQIEAWKAFVNNNYIGICDVCTGAGKTFFGLKFIDEFKDSTFLIVVPTIALMEQWKSEIKKILNIDCGRMGNGYDEIKQITVSVINSVREKKLNFDNLILDEVHHYSAPESIKLLKNNTFNKILGLSATSQNENGINLEEFGLKIVYSYSQKQAIVDKILCMFEMVNIPVTLSKDEQILYDINNLAVKDNLKKFGNDLNVALKAKGSFMKTKLFRAINKRKFILANARGKLISTVRLVDKHKDDKIIIFCEFIETTEVILKLLTNHNIPAAIFHSGIKGKEKTEMLRKFKDNELRIMISCKCLDEGVNIVDANVGILVASTKTKRQIIQRLGRLLRKKEKKAIIYQLYVEETVDEKALNVRNSYIQWGGENGNNNGRFFM